MQDLIAPLLSLVDSMGYGVVGSTGETAMRTDVVAGQWLVVAPVGQEKINEGTMLVEILLIRCTDKVALVNTVEEGSCGTP